MISVGVGGAWPHEVIAGLAPLAESAGFARLWVNDVPGGDALAGLARAAAATSTLRLASGVIPVDRRPGERIAEDVAALGLPRERLDLGVGPGSAPSPVPRVAAALAALHPLGAKLWVGALGPRMRRLAAEQADGLLLNWLTPDDAAEAAALARSQAQAAGRPRPTVALYVRTAVDPAAAEELAQEAARYGRVPAYARNFERLGMQASDAAIGPGDDARSRLAEYEQAVDEVVVRLVLPGEPRLEDARRILDAVRPAAAD